MQTIHTPGSDEERQPRDLPWPAGIQLGLGSAAMVVVAFGAAIFTAHGSLARLLVMAIAAGLGAALMSDWRYSLGLGVIGYLLYTGFLVNLYGELSWQGRSSLWELAIFAFAYWLGLGQRWMRSAVTTEAGITDSSEPRQEPAIRRTEPVKIGVYWRQRGFISSLPRRNPAGGTDKFKEVHGG